MTRGAFAAFVSATGHRTDGGCYARVDRKLQIKAGVTWQSPDFEQNDRHPVVCVTWHDAKAYVAWLSRETGQRYRLLSETEREYVTRAGTTTPFWWGASISYKQASYNASLAYGSGVAGPWQEATFPVDSFSANPWGLFNVHGNVGEWTEDCWNDTNAGNPGDGSARTNGDCAFRVWRGGAWSHAPTLLRAAFRGKNYPNTRFNSQGFRVARSL